MQRNASWIAAAVLGTLGFLLYALVLRPPSDDVVLAAEKYRGFHDQEAAKRYAFSEALAARILGEPMVADYIENIGRSREETIDVWQFLARTRTAAENEYPVRNILLGNREGLTLVNAAEMNEVTKRLAGIDPSTPAESVFRGIVMTGEGPVLRLIEPVGEPGETHGYVVVDTGWDETMARELAERAGLPVVLYGIGDSGKLFEPLAASSEALDAEPPRLAVFRKSGDSFIGSKDYRLEGKRMHRVFLGFGGAARQELISCIEFQEPPGD